MNFWHTLLFYLGLTDTFKMDAGVFVYLILYLTLLLYKPTGRIGKRIFFLNIKIFPRRFIKLIDPMKCGLN